MASVMRQVQVVAVRQHQVEGAGRRQRHLGLHRLDTQRSGCGRAGLRREFGLALVDPLHPAGQAGQQRTMARPTWPAP
jgi:hypothetical protein